MPRRPRQHALEAESRRAFASLLPSSWVVHDRGDDYGVDGEVEIFEAEQATGLTFYFQLKATDTPISTGVLRVRLKQSTANYLRSLDAPVLLVAYHAPTEKTFARWFHSSALEDITTETFSIEFDEGDHWFHPTPTDISEQVAAWRRFRPSTLTLPIMLGVSGLDEAGRSDAAGLSAALEQAAKGIGHFVAINRSGEKPDVQVEVGADEVVISLPSLSETAMERQVGAEPHTEAYDVLVAVGLLLDLLGQTELAARILIEASTSSSLVEADDLLWEIGGCLTRASRVGDLLELVDQLRVRLSADASWGREVLESITLLTGFPELQSREKRDVEDRLRRRIGEAEDREDFREAAMLHYNLGKQMRGRWDDALFHLSSAVSYDPTYADRDYFYKELGGLFFETDHFEFAAEFYARALNLGAAKDVRPLLADALMFQGKYREAEDAFMAAEVLDDPVWPSDFRLKAALLPWMREQLGVDEQIRSPREAHAMAETAQSQSSPINREETCLRALAVDGLCGLAWYQLGLVKARASDSSDGFPYFVMAALSRPDVIDAWVSATMTGPGSDYGEALGVDVATAAYHRHGPAFELAVQREIKNQGWESAMTTEFIKAFADLISSLPKRKETIEMRLIDEHGGYTTLLKGERESGF